MAPARKISGEVCAPEQGWEGCKGRVNGRVLLQSSAFAQANVQQLVGSLMLREVKQQTAGRTLNG